MKATIRRVVLALAPAVLIGACSGDTPTAAPVLSPIIVTPKVSTAPADRGQIVSAGPFTDISPAVSAVASSAVRATYRSTSAASGAETAVTGSFFVPRGTPPTGGWPVISFAHGTTGLTNGCGLSSTPDLRGYAPTIRGLLSVGYAVAVTDYEGLGPSGEHPYLEPRTAAFNVIDAVRALRTLAPTVSTRWLGYGESQGGQAVWAADELARSYGDGLELVGALSVKPAANVTAIAQTASRGALTSDQRAIASMIAVGAVRGSAGALSVADLLPGVSAQQISILIGCDAGQKNSVATGLDEKQLAPVDAATEARYADRLRRDALPQGAVTAPLRVVYGSADRVIPATWVSTAVRDACTLGGAITARVAVGEGHSDQMTDDTDLTWVQDRFAGAAAPRTC